MNETTTHTEGESIPANHVTPQMVPWMMPPGYQMPPGYHVGHMSGSNMTESGFQMPFYPPGFQMKTMQSTSSAPPKTVTKKLSYDMVDALKHATKKDFEIVIARYDEDITWSDNYKEFRTVYNKGDPIDNVETIDLPNEGDLIHTIITHIIQNYDNLATTTFFAQGSLQNNKDCIIKEQKPCHRIFSDFIVVDPNACVYIKRYFPCKQHDAHNNYDFTFTEVYERIFERPVPPERLVWALWTNTSLGRDVIRKRPKEFYEKIKEFCLEPYRDEPPTQSIFRTRNTYMERFLIHAVEFP